MRSVGVILVIWWAVAFPPLAQAQESCGPLRSGVGPYDYRTKNKEERKQIGVVERAHFFREVEFPPPGRRGPVGGKLDYTLRAIPNHHRALAALAKLDIRLKRESGYVSKNKGLMKGLDYVPACYFHSAIGFAPDDGVVRMVYGMYLMESGAKVEALQQLTIAEKLEPNNGNLQYNIGLVLFEMKDYDGAVERAKRAQELGFALDGLRTKLERIDKWP
jgi:tetratricopeptide (TPR) repeat protein